MFRPPLPLCQPPPCERARCNDVGQHFLSPDNLNLLCSIPTSRNSFDRVLDGFQNGTTKSTPCTCANNGPCEMGSAREKGGGGQPCLWWSQGCSIGCDFCLTDPRHPDNHGSIPTSPITGNPPHADKAGFRKSYCSQPSTEDVLPKEFWTMNIHAEPRAENDSYRCKFQHVLFGLQPFCAYFETVCFLSCLSVQITPGGRLVQPQ